MSLKCQKQGYRAWVKHNKISIDMQMFPICNIDWNSLFVGLCVGVSVCRFCRFCPDPLQVARKSKSQFPPLVMRTMLTQLLVGIQMNGENSICDRKISPSLKWHHLRGTGHLSGRVGKLMFHKCLLKNDWSDFYINRTSHRVPNTL